MFAWWKTKKSNRSATGGYRIRPFLERLEERDCPSGMPGLQLGPQITFFNAMAMQGNTVLLAGMVSDPNPASVCLSFSGAASGMTWADSTGCFQLQTQATALGTVFALGFDNAGLTATALTNIVAPPPTLTSFTIMQSGPNCAVTVMGQVSAGAGLTVSLSGIVTGTVITDANGSFTFSGTASGTGQVNASVTDVWGQTGTGSTQLTNLAPTITNFQAESTGFQNIWTIEGQVTDEWAAGETVTFTGLVPLQNITVTVSSNGWFSFQVQIPPSDNGLVVATVTDWYGATGQAQIYV
jgi:hypothetical protein